MSLYLGNTEDFIKAYYEECRDEKITREMAYERTEKRYYLQNKEWIDKGKMKETKFSSYISFANVLGYHLKKSRK